MPITTAQQTQARDWFVRRAQTINPNGDAAVILSGGVDSATLFFACIEAGQRPPCYTFHRADFESSDLIVARQMAQTFGCTHTAIPIPVDVPTLRTDITRTLTSVDWSRTSRIKKTIVQCVHPFLYVYPQIEALTILCGLGGDSFFLTDRKSQELLHAEGDDAVRAMRRSWFADPHYSDWHIADVGQRLYGKTLIDAYDASWLAAWFQQFSDRELNRPITKHATVSLFADYWARGAWYRQPSAFQVNSRLREAHDQLLHEPGETARGIIAIYTRIAKALRLRVGGREPRRDAEGNCITEDGLIIGAPTDADRAEVERVSQNIVA